MLQGASIRENKHRSALSVRPGLSNAGRSAVQLHDNRSRSYTASMPATYLTDNRNQSIIQKKENRTGLPDNLKSGIEDLSGYSMDDVKVHYNSDKPAALNAHAFAKGTDIHVASGQEKHLAHEAWHVVQQKQGRVKPTRQMKAKVNINDDKGLEEEADVMGNKALQLKPNDSERMQPFKVPEKNQAPVQRKKGVIKTNRPAISSEPVVQALRGRLTQDPGDHEIYLYDADTNQPYGLSPEELRKANVGDRVGYKVIGGHSAEITDYAGMDNVSKIILDAANSLGIRDPVLLSLLMDFSIEQIRLAGGIRGQLKKYLGDWKSFTACYSTADSLFQLLMTGNATENPGHNIASTRDALIAAVGASVSNGAIIRIRCGIHGFVIMVRGGENVELLQSFAGGSGEPLSTSLLASKSWPLARMITLLTNMVSNSKPERTAAQEELFGGGITADQWPPAQYTWRKAALKSPDEIANDVAARLEANYRELRVQLR